MKTQIINHVQGTLAWHQHRALHLNASDAAVVLGISSYKTRSQLLHEKSTGLIKDVDASTQKRFAKGHEFEAIARPWGEEIIGGELFPIVLAGEHEGLQLSASLDGVDMASEFTFEHKSGRADLLSSLDRNEIPSEYHPQMEMGLMLSGASKCLFMASSGEKDAMRYAWYEPNLQLRAQIIAAWHQFQVDLASYEAPPITVAPIAKAVASLPVVFDMRVEGKLASCNLEKYKPAALAYIDAINTKLETDQNFVDADADAKYCRESADKLELSIDLALGQMGDISQALNTVREIAAAFDAKGLALEKLVKAEKENRRMKIISDAVTGFAGHMDKLNARLGKAYMPTITADFQGVVKGLKSIDSMNDKVATELARVKIEANATANRIQANLETLKELASDHKFLFADTSTIVMKANDDLTALIKSRIADHVAAEAVKAEAVKAEALRASIQAEEQAKAEARAAAAHAEALAHEAATKASADAIARAQVEAQKPAPALVEHAPVAIKEVAAPAPVCKSVQVAPASKPKTDAPPTLPLGEISARLGFNVTSSFLATLGFEATTVRAAKLFQEDDFLAICAAVIDHIKAVQEQFEPATA